MPGDAVHFNPLQLIQEGAIWLPGTIGWSAFKRFYGHDMACEQTLQSHAPENFAYLWVLGVHPEAKGQGLGKRVLRSAMEAMRRRGYSSCFRSEEHTSELQSLTNLVCRLLLEKKKKNKTKKNKNKKQ